MLAIALSIALHNLLTALEVPFFITSGVAYSVAAVSFLLTPISIFLFGPAWVLDDSGIIFLKKENYDELVNAKTLSKPLDVRGIGSYFIQLAKGFAGISTPLLYIILFIQEEIFKSGLELGILLILEPFFLVGSFFFSMLIYIKILPKVRERLLRKLSYAEIRINIEF
jgi:hypothetical protein